MDYPIPNPALVKTKVCYGLAATALTTVVPAYTEVRGIPSNMHLSLKAPAARTILGLMLHMRTRALVQHAFAARHRTLRHGWDYPSMPRRTQAARTLHAARSLFI